MTRVAPITVVEMPEFLSVSRKFMDEAERWFCIWLTTRSKRGGARVIYYFHSDRIPVFIITAYAKNVQTDLSAADKSDFKRIIKLLARSYGRTRP